MQWRPISEVPSEYKEGRYLYSMKPIIIGWRRQDGSSHFETAQWLSERFQKGRSGFWCWNIGHDHAWQAENQPTHFMIPDPIPAEGA